MSEQVEMSVMVDSDMLRDFDEEVEKSVLHTSRSSAVREAMGEWMVKRYEERTEE
jgi:metal-responsive CopG/Arc/MetJ family transcriptional regulator